MGEVLDWRVAQEYLTNEGILQRGDSHGLHTRRQCRNADLGRPGSAGVVWPLNYRGHSGGDWAVALPGWALYHPASDGAERPGGLSMGRIDRGPSRSPSALLQDHCARTA